MKQAGGRVEASILKLLRSRKTAALTDRQIAERLKCSAAMVWSVRRKHKIPSGNVIELGYAARRIGLTLADLRAIAQQREARP